jgi:catechol 2,3-dioxygenase-like lactoylglutathione lyase family enzyme
MLEGVAVVWMPVQDIERAKGFYKDTLGLRITNEDGEWAEVDANGPAGISEHPWGRVATLMEG